MIRHTVLMRLTDGAGEAQRAAIAQALNELPRAIPEIRSLSFGFDAGLVDGNADLVVDVDFDAEQGYLVYANHPAHLAMIAKLIRPFLAERMAIQRRLPGSSQ